MKLSRDDLIERITAMAGDNPSDEFITLIEDVSDTVVDGSDDWKSKYEENDRAWRKKYIERFSGKESEGDNEESEGDNEESDIEAPKTFDELFKEE